MKARDLIEVFHGVCASRGNWRLALRAASSLIASPSTYPTTDDSRRSMERLMQPPQHIQEHRVRYAQVGSAVRACQTASAHGWREAAVVLARLWSRPCEGRLDVRALHVVATTCAREGAWEPAMRFLVTNVLLDSTIWTGDRSDVVRDAVLAVAAASPRNIGWSAGLRALTSSPLLEDAKPVSLRVVSHFLTSMGVGNRTEWRRTRATSDWVAALHLVSTALRHEPRRHGGERNAVSVSALNEAIQVMIGLRGVRARQILNVLQQLSGEPLCFALSRGSISCLGERAEWDNTRDMVSIAIMIFSRRDLFPHHLLSVSAIVPLVRLLKAHHEADVVLRWFAQLPSESNLRTNLRVVAPIAVLESLSARWWRALEMVMTVDSNIETCSAAVCRATVVVLRVAGRWRDAITYTQRVLELDGASGDGGGRGSATRNVLFESHEIWSKVLQLMSSSRGTVR